MLGTHPVRQESLGDFGVSLLRTKTSSGSQNLFHDVLEQVCDEHTKEVLYCHWLKHEFILQQID